MTGVTASSGEEEGECIPRLARPPYGYAVQITDEKRSLTVSDENFERFTKCAVEVLSVDAGQVTREASFADDLDADSLDLVELIMALEEEFGVTVEEEELEGITTIGSAYDLIACKL